MPFVMTYLSVNKVKSDECPKTAEAGVLLHSRRAC